MKVTFDKEGDSAYIHFCDISPGQVKKTTQLNNQFNVDFDSEGKILGMEILDARKNLPAKMLMNCVA